MLPFQVEGVAAAEFVGHPAGGATRSVASSVPRRVARRGRRAAPEQVLTIERVDARLAGGGDRAPGEKDLGATRARARVDRLAAVVLLGQVEVEAGIRGGIPRPDRLDRVSAVEVFPHARQRLPRVELRLRSPLCRRFGVQAGSKRSRDGREDREQDRHGHEQLDERETAVGAQEAPEPLLKGTHAAHLGIDAADSLAPFER